MNVALSLSDVAHIAAHVQQVKDPSDGSSGRFITVNLGPDVQVILHGYGDESAKQAERIADALNDAAEALRAGEQGDMLRAQDRDAQDAERQSLRGLDETAVAEHF